MKILRMNEKGAQITKKLHLYDNTLSYSRLGSGPVLLFLHGFLGDSTVWDWTIECLLVKYTCLSIDLPGHGRSEMHSSDYSFDSLALSILAILEIEELDEVHIIGHSMGGYAGLSLAKLIPSRVKSITLVNSTAYPDSSQKKIERDRASQVFDLNPKVYIKTAIKNLIYQANQSRLTDEVEELFQVALNLSVAGAKAALVAMRDRTSSVHFLKNSQLPVHLISGRYDTVCPLDKGIEQIKGVNAKHSILENCGHMAFVEEPEELIKLIRS
jgi:pimeloyl-ACP methyl ester carboxylesterase